MKNLDIKNDELKSRIQFSFVEAMTIFVFTIIIGILNAVDLVEFTRAELLFHLHSGTIGWISLSAITLLVWYFSASREMSENSVKMGVTLLKYVQIIIPIYVFFFYLTYSLALGENLFRIIDTGNGSNFYYVIILIGGILTTFGFIWTTFFGFMELRELEVKTTPHYLFLGAVTTASYAGIFGIVLEIQRLFEISLFDPNKGQDGVASHAGAMEVGYLFMIIAAVLEWQIINEKKAADIWGKVQVFCFFFAGFTVAIGAGFNIFFLVTLNLPLEIIGVVIFIKRVVMAIDPKSIMKTDHTKFHIPAAVFMIISVLFFIYIISQIVGGRDIVDLFSSPLTGSMFLANNHALFIGGASGVIFASIAMLYSETQDLYPKVEYIGFVLMYVGLIGFMITLIYRGALAEDLDPAAADVRTDIASIMGIGLFTLMFVYISRLRNIKSEMN